MIAMGLKPTWWYTQSGVLAYRFNKGKASEQSPLEILLITSRKGKRWVIPKGIVEPGMSPQESAIKEAFEEAGITGRISNEAFGSYTRKKWNGRCNVEVFPLEVTTVFDEWPEADFRQREWLSVEEAASRVREEPLKAILRKLPEKIL